MTDLTRTERVLYRLARWFVTASVILSVWLFASAEPWAYIITCLGVLTGGFFWLFSLVCYPHVRLRSTPLIVILFLLLVFLLFQTIPLSLSTVSTLSPFAAEIKQEAISVLQQSAPHEDVVAKVNPWAEKATISFSPLATQRSISLFATYFIAFLVMSNCIRRWRHLRNIALLLITSGFILAVLGLVHKFSGSFKLLWVYSTPGNMFATFTNRNHYAFYANMVFGLTIGLFLASSYFNITDARDWREKLAWFSTKMASRIVLLLFAAVFLSASVVVSLSRGGVVALIMSAGLVGAICSFRRDVLPHGKVLPAVALLVMAVVIWLGWEPVAERFGTLAQTAADPINDSRAIATIDTLRIFDRCFVFGCGFGSFQYVFPIFQQPAIQFGRWMHAHNDWAQLLAEGGAIAMFLVLFALAFFYAEIRNCVSIKVDSRARRFIAGSIIGLIAAMLHSFMDYSLHKPSNALLLMTICGMLVAAVHLRERLAVVLDGAKIAKPSKPYGVRMRFVVQLVACLLMVLFVFFTAKGLGCLRRELAYKRFEYNSRLVGKLDKSDDLTVAVKASLLDAGRIFHNGYWDPEGFRNIAYHCFNWSFDNDIDDELRTDSANMAFRISSLLVLNAPSDYASWLWQARSQALLGLWSDSELSLARARELNPSSYSVDLLLEGNR